MYYDERGEIIERLDYAVGRIVKMGQQDNVVTFTAEDDTFDGIGEKDERRRKTVEDVRRQFKREMLGAASAGGIGWWMNLFAAAAGNWIGVCLDAFGFVRQDKRRAAAQRWQARKRIYWFTTTPRIPWKWRRKRGYPIRADTLAEGKRKLYREVIGKIWLFPRSWINLIVGVDGRPLEFFDLDRIREAMDPERWKETETARQWGRGGSP